MVKRSRYEYVTLVNGSVHICANNKTYVLDSIKSWTMKEYTNKFNPEDVEYIIHIISRTADVVITCKDSDELDCIGQELKEQGI